MFYTGTFWYPDGSRYEGSWVEDQRNGTGTYYYVNGDLYQGEWYMHKRHGQGTYTYSATGSRYRGTWDEGKKKGSGEIVNENHKYLGEILFLSQSSSFSFIDYSFCVQGIYKCITSFLCYNILVT